MRLREITAVLEQFAPLSLQEAYDNAGLIAGHPQMEVTGVLLCLDVTESVLNEAIAIGANLIVSHHPIVFSPLKSITGRDRSERAVIQAIKNGIALYAAHTNLDRARHGMSHALAEKLGLRNIEVLDPVEVPAHSAAGFGAVGELAEPVGAMDFLRTVKRTFGVDGLRHNTPAKEKVRRVAVCSGAGGDLLEKAVESGADVYLTAEVKHHVFLDAESRILLADIGHFESEIGAISLLHEILTKKIPTFALHKSGAQPNPVSYL